MGNQIAERVFNFMSTNFSAFVFSAFAILLAVTGIFIIIKRLIFPTPLLPSTNRLNDIVRTQLEQEVRNRHIVFQRNRLQRLKYKKILEHFSMEVTEENLKPLDSHDIVRRKKSRDENKQRNDPVSSVYLHTEQTLYLPRKNQCTASIDCKNKRSRKSCNMTCNSINVPPQCLICLENYLVGDQIVWSSNPNCIHVFHEECILTWLSKMGEGFCPLCRQNFCPEEEENMGLQCEIETDRDTNFNDEPYVLMY